MNKVNLIFVFLFFCLSCNSGKQLISKHFFAMGTKIEIKVLPIKNRNAEKDLEMLKERIEGFQNLIDPYKARTIIRNLNKKTFMLFKKEKDYKTVHELITRALFIAYDTDGAFDPSLLKLTEVWGFSGFKNRKQPPEKKDIIASMKHVGYRNIILGNYRLVILRHGVKLDLGGIAKGTAADMIKGELVTLGYRKAIIDIGKDLYLIGGRINDKHNKGWIVAIQNPRNKDKYFCYLRIKNAAVVTSGDYERYYFFNNKRYHHILDPSTGYPSEKCISVTVLGPSAELADAYATALFVMGPKKGIRFINRKKDYEAMFIIKNKTNIKPVFSTNFKSKYKYQSVNK